MKSKYKGDRRVIQLSVQHWPGPTRVAVLTVSTGVLVKRAGRGGGAIDCDMCLVTTTVSNKTNQYSIGSRNDLCSTDVKVNVSVVLFLGGE
jgi:hypothetical protein